jgi:hypothetical protein
MFLKKIRLLKTVMQVDEPLFRHRDKISVFLASH